MILVRSVLQARYEKGNELLALVKEISQKFPTQQVRILTDVDGPFFTIVSEATFESLETWEQEAVKAISLPEFGSWVARIMPLLHSGRREFYNVEA